MATATYDVAGDPRQARGLLLGTLSAMGFRIHQDDPFKAVAEATVGGSGSLFGGGYRRLDINFAAGYGGVSVITLTAVGTARERVARYHRYVEWDAGIFSRMLGLTGEDLRPHAGYAERLAEAKDYEQVFDAVSAAFAQAGVLRGARTGP
ncbi:MAG: hypothetical protein LBK95_17775 [Bifidobacteriaceae bacterium]|jgi:hypothetical protein|nr:hypothetical protein [Bifidobacteriaceae bacterium]